MVNFEFHRIQKVLSLKNQHYGLFDHQFGPMLAMVYMGTCLPDTKQLCEPAHLESTHTAGTF